MNKKVIISYIIKYSVATFVATGMLLLAIFTRNITNVEDNKEKIRILVDGFTIPGIIFCLLGILIWLTNQGTLTGVSYAFRHAIRMLIPGSKKREETYYEYKESRKKFTGYLFIYVVGGLFLLVGIILLIIFYSI